MRTAIEIARKAGRKVAFTLSDVFCISRHGDDFRRLLAEGQIDILFANENELTALAEVDDFEAAVAAIAPQVPVLVRSEEHTSELQSLMRISYAVFCLKKKKTQTINSTYHEQT